MQKKPILFALAWAGATFFIVNQFAHQVTEIAQSAANQAAEITVRELQEKSNRFCESLTRRNPTYDSDEIVTLCNTVSLLYDKEDSQ